MEFLHCIEEGFNVAMLTVLIFSILPLSLSALVSAAHALNFPHEKKKNSKKGTPFFLSVGVQFPWRSSWPSNGCHVKDQVAAVQTLSEAR